ncbi:MAG: LptF/LptG family permease [Phycisphaerae bacterium]|nr:LptF/LptG family permease [Phycisphaerae bacterium]
MFTTIDRYIMRSFFGGFFILLGVGIGMYVLLDLLFNLDEFTKDGEVPLLEALRAIIDYYGYNVPLYFSQLAAPLMAISAGYALGAMLRNNEQTPLVAAGMPLQRLLVPIGYCALLLVPVIFINREFVIPQIAPKLAREHDDTTAGHARAARCIRDARGNILTARQLDVAAGTLRGIAFVSAKTESGVVHLVQADAGVWDAEAKVWRLDRGSQLRVGGSGAADSLSATPIDTLPFSLPPEELLLRQSAEWSDLLSTRELGELVKNQQLPNRGTILQSLILRFTEPVSQLILLALAVPFFLTRERQNVINAAGWSLIASGLFFATSYIARELVSDPQSALLAAGIPIIVFGPVAVLLLLNVKT